jgi:polygalacturonase
MEAIGPFASWVNVKIAFGAVGDGMNDDTAAIQEGLDSLRKFNADSGPVVLYFPRGTYRITGTLTMELDSGANLVGADPATTSIVWDGPAGGTMLLTSGSFDTLFARLTWNGAGTAGIGVAQWWNYIADRGNYQGSIKHVDEVFENMGIGIYGGRLGAAYGQGDSETLIERVRFVGESVAGINLGSFNALDWWIWDSQFVGCALGVTNDYSVDDAGPTVGAGNFMVYRSTFEGSTVADVGIGNVQWFSLHDNVSIGSRQFLFAAPTGANAAIIVQGNTVIDTVDPTSIQVGNAGPLMLIDNRIRSRPGTTTAVVELDGAGATPAQGDRDVLSYGNWYTVAEPILITTTASRLLTDGDTVVAPASIPSPSPAPPAVARNFNRAVLEVAAGADATAIQAAIDAAAVSQSPNAVVHLPPGIYLVDKTIVVPAGVQLQIAGDAESTALYWTGTPAAGPLLMLQGPSYATVRDIALYGTNATAIAITHADQYGGRIFIQGSEMAAVSASGLQFTQIDAQANTGLHSLSVAGPAHVLSTGCGGLGPIRLTADGSLMVADSWYEGSLSALFRGDSGTFTYLGGHIAPFSSGVAPGQSPDAPAVLLDGYSGSVSFVGAELALGSAANGIVVGANAAATNGLFLGISGNQAGYFKSATAGGDTIGLVLAKLGLSNGPVNLPAWGRSDPGFVAGGLTQARSIVWASTPFPHTPGATDVRLFRVFTQNMAAGLTIDP